MAASPSKLEGCPPQGRLGKSLQPRQEAADRDSLNTGHTASGTSREHACLPMIPTTGLLYSSSASLYHKRGRSHPNSYRENLAAGEVKDSPGWNLTRETRSHATPGRTALLGATGGRRHSLRHLYPLQGALGLTLVLRITTLMASGALTKPQTWALLAKHLRFHIVGAFAGSPDASFCKWPNQEWRHMQMSTEIMAPSKDVEERKKAGIFQSAKWVWNVKNCFVLTSMEVCHWKCSRTMKHDYWVMESFLLINKQLTN